MWLLRLYHQRIESFSNYFRGWNNNNLRLLSLDINEKCYLYQLAPRNLLPASETKWINSIQKCSWNPESCLTPNSSLIQFPIFIVGFKTLKQKQIIKLKCFTNFLLGWKFVLCFESLNWKTFSMLITEDFSLTLLFYLWWHFPIKMQSNCFAVGQLRVCIMIKSCFNVSFG